MKKLNRKHKKIVLVIIVAFVLFLLLFPIKMRLADGIHYDAVLYQIVSVYRLSMGPHDGTSRNCLTKGTKIYILGSLVYDDTETILVDTNE